ncbi:MAG: cysteine--tRNA ligase [Sphingobacteriales bacterium]|nr:MAG: cysteine--tRNA ligase [Sphingobacteriales bacterium]TAF79606.1 MAG: cysteine--tRNA ligase [Sphingobacteriales bacterium]
MKQNLFIYNTLSKQKQLFKAINAPYVGMYVCGPTVYSDVHLGNCRTFLAFDLMYRYLQVLGYKVRYIRNITDAGHLEGDGDTGEDKISQKAKLAQVEPMEIVQTYSNGFHSIMQQFNALAPSIEPTATGHIIEQIELVKIILQNGLAYEINGSVYFDVDKYSLTQDYGILNNRKLDDMLANTRNLGGQNEKRGKLDFALWIKAKPEHLMQWSSPWGMGFPGWHLECSAMSHKYLGQHFDIHGGGMDLAPTHHTNEIAQNMAVCGKHPANFWIHTNMLTVNGQKMSKSLGNSFLPQELFTGQHALLQKGYSPMVVKFFMYQAHYRSTLDFSNEALNASEKGFKKMMAAVHLLPKIIASNVCDVDIIQWRKQCFAAMNDDFNSPILIAELFEGVRIINSLYDGHLNIDAQNLEILSQTFALFLVDVLGIPLGNTENNDTAALMDFIVQLRNDAKQNKNFATSDKIRDGLQQLGFEIKDSKEGTVWAKK